MLNSVCKKILLLTAMLMLLAVAFGCSLAEEPAEAACAHESKTELGEFGCWECTDCGTSDHGDGLCKDSCEYCGAPNTCPHEGKYEGEESWIDIIEIISYDTFGHDYLGAFVQTMQCADCHCCGWHEEVSRGNYRDNHILMDGHCYDCDYAMSGDCEHPEQYVQYDTYEDYGDADYVDENTHDRYYKYVDDAVCRLCGTTVYSYEGSEETKSEAHYFAEWSDGCAYCDYVPVCTHENTEIRYTSETHYYNMGGLTREVHARHVAKQPWKYCTDCGATIEDYELENEVVKYIEPHNWDGGVCSGCGLLMPEDFCTHERVGSRWDGFEDEKITSISPDLHLREGTAVYEEFCLDCDEVFGRKYIENVQEVSAHSGYLNEDGICEYCNYVSDGYKHNYESCNHMTGETIYEYRSVPGDRNTPCTLEYWGMNYCLLCRDAYRNFVLDSGIQHESAHSYGDNETVCMFCGYISACSHENTSEDYHGEPYYVVKDADTHTRYADSWAEEIHCDDCGASIYADGTFRGLLTTEEPHRFVYGFCVDCGYEQACDHVNTEVFVHDTDEYHEYWTYVPYDEKYHKGTGMASEETRCVDCGKLINWRNIEISLLTEHYAFEEDDYICYDCGEDCSWMADYICPHENTTTYTMHDYMWDDSAVPVEGGHQIVADLVEYTECTWCYEILSSRVIEEDVVRVSPHEYAGGSECVWCYAPLTYCLHENTHRNEWDSTGSRENWVTYPKNEESHVLERWLSYDVICDDCDSILSDGTEYYVVKEESAHDFIDRTCKSCGYTITCPHENVIHYYSDVRVVEITGADVYGHTYTGIWVDDYLCLDCVEILPEEKPIAEYRESHTYDENGVCTLEGCGYVRTGDCPCLDKPEQYLLSSYTDPVFSEAGEDGHIITYSKCITACVLCGDGWESDVTYKVLERHEYIDGDDSCASCGYQSACSHENRSVVEELSEAYRTYFGTLETHTKNVETFIVTVCDDCGASLGTEPGGVIYVTEPHEWDAGLCKCGLVHPGTGCDHAEIEPAGQKIAGDDGACISLGAYHHVMESTFILKYRCAICGMDVDTVDVYEGSREVLFHYYYDENGDETDTCYYCGYTRKTEDGEIDYCEHGYNDKVSFSYSEEFGDENTPCSLTIIKVTTCGLCGSAYDFVEVACGVEADYVHSYESGNRACVNCGHISECRHENVTTDVDELPECYYGLKDAENHVLLRANWVRYICADCGAGIRTNRSPSERDFAETVEPHRFVDGVCYSCGYSCGHEQTSEFVLHPDRPVDAEDMEYGFETFERLDASGHLAKGTALNGSRCDACGMVLEYVPTEFSLIEGHFVYDDEAYTCACGEDMSWRLNCAHSAVVTDYWYEEVEMDGSGAEGHVWLADRIAYEYCADCGAEVSYEVIETGVPLEESHYDDLYDEDILCDDCGWQILCAHENTYTENTDVLPGICVPKDGNTHIAYEYIEYAVYCEDCHAKVNSGSAEDSQERWIHVENHSYLNGMCEKCGFVKGEVALPAPGANEVYAAPGDRFMFYEAGIAEQLGDQAPAYAVSEKTVAVVDENGVVEVLKAGEATVDILLGGEVLFSVKLIVDEMDAICIPEALSEICEEAFAGDIIASVDMSGNNFVSIGTSAFADCENLKQVLLPAVSEIADGAFSGCDDVVLFCRNADQARYAADQQHSYVFMP